MDNSKTLRVCFFGTYRKMYVRNRLNIDRLRQQGIEVIECHSQLWNGDEDRENIAKGGWKKPLFWFRVIAAYIKLFWQFSKTGDFDIMFIGYPGHFDIPLAKLICILRKKPLVWDVYMSLYLIALERKINHKSPITLRIIKFFEKIDFQLPDVVLVDTESYKNWYKKNYKLNDERIRYLPSGADDRVFKPQIPKSNQKGFYACIYYGSFIPNHGVEVIIQSANLIKNEPNIIFELVGKGPELAHLKRLTKDLYLTNVRFINWLSVGELVDRIAIADICLGVFGNTPQSIMTIQNKIFEGLAMGKPIITGYSPVVQSEFQHATHLYLCERENPRSLAEAIIKLWRNPAISKRMSQEGYKEYSERFSFEKLGNNLAKILLALHCDFTRS